MDDFFGFMSLLDKGELTKDELVVASNPFIQNERPYDLASQLPSNVDGNLFNEGIKDTVLINLVNTLLFQTIQSFNDPYKVEIVFSELMIILNEYVPNVQQRSLEQTKYFNNKYMELFDKIARIYRSLGLFYELKMIGDIYTNKIFSNTHDIDPYWIDMTSDGELVVGSTNKRVMIIPLPARSSTSKSWVSSKLPGHIRALAVDSEGNNEIYLAAADGTKIPEIHVYKKDGTHQRKLILKLPGNRLYSIHGILFISKKEMIITDQENNLLYLFDRAGNLLRILGADSKGLSLLEGRPRQATYDFNKKLIYVAIRERTSQDVRGRVKVLNIKGEVVNSWGFGQLKEPHGIAFDKNKNVLYIGDAGNNRVITYSTTGRELAELHNSNFREPRFIVIDKRKIYENRFYTTSYKDKKIGILNLGFSRKEPIVYP